MIILCACNLYFIIYELFFPDMWRMLAQPVRHHFFLLTGPPIVTPITCKNLCLNPILILYVGDMWSAGCLPTGWLIKRCKIFRHSVFFLIIACSDRRRWWPARRGERRSCNSQSDLFYLSPRSNCTGGNIKPPTHSPFAKVTYHFGPRARAETRHAIHIR